jgi:hypothetical protein
MSARLIFSIVCCVALASACSNGDTTAATQDNESYGSWLTWHAEKQGVDMVVLNAINHEPPDYATAVDAIRKSNRPPADTKFEVGQLIVGGIMERSPRRSPETLEEGLRMMEDAALVFGPKDLSAVQQLRFLFERGDGTPPNAFPADKLVAACWLNVEEHRSVDIQQCIDLRRKRLPDVNSSVRAPA